MGTESKNSRVGGEPSSERGTSWRSAVLLAGVIGVVAGPYTGYHLLLPFAGCFAIMKLLRRASPAVVVQGGHALCFLVGYLIRPETLLRWDFHNLLYNAGWIWLFLRPSKWAVVSLSAFQIFYLFNHGLNFLQAEAGSHTYQGLVYHSIFRTLGLLLMWLPPRRKSVPEQLKSSRAA